MSFYTTRVHNPLVAVVSNHLDDYLLCNYGLLFVTFYLVFTTMTSYRRFSSQCSNLHSSSAVEGSSFSSGQPEDEKPKPLYKKLIPKLLLLAFGTLAISIRLAREGRFLGRAILTFALRSNLHIYLKSYV